MSIAVNDKLTGSMKIFLADGSFFTADVQMTVIGTGDPATEADKAKAEAAAAAAGATGATGATGAAHGATGHQGAAGHHEAKK